MHARRVTTLEGALAAHAPFLASGDGLASDLHRGRDGALKLETNRASGVGRGRDVWALDGLFGRSRDERPREDTDQRDRRRSSIDPFARAD
jgi:hypothetical protein